MSIIHQLSSKALLSELDLFGIPPTQLSIERGYETEHRPISTLSSNSPIDFVIATSPDEYILLSESYLHTKIRLANVKKNGLDMSVDDWKQLSCIRNFSNSIFESCKLTIGNKEITYSAGNYGYRSYFDLLLGFGKSAKDSHLSAGGFNYFNDINTNTLTIEPASSKHPFLSKTISLLGKIHTDLTFQEKGLLGGADIKIQLYPNKPEFYFQFPSEITFDVEFLSASFYVYRVKATPELFNAHHKALAIASAKYPITRTEVKYASISRGISDATIDNLVIGQLPRRVLIAMVSGEQFNGTSNEDPYYFEHFGLKYLSLSADGTIYPSKPFSPDFDNDDYLREYYGLFQCLNQNGTYSTVNISRRKYKNGFTIFGFNLTPDLSSGGQHLNPIKRGTLNISLKFKKSLENPIVVIAYCEFDNLIQINNDRSVATDYM